MKITLILIVALIVTVILPYRLDAQDSKGSQEFSLSYGITSGTDMLQGFYRRSSRPNYDHPTYNQATAMTGNMFATYRYFINRRLDVGVTLGTEVVTYYHYTNPTSGDVGLIGKYKASVTTLAAELKPVYYNGRFVQLYGLIGIGARYFQTTQTEFGPALIARDVSHVTPFSVNSQWTPIGVRAGEKLCGFAEFGLGYKGLINVGISYKTDRNKHKDRHKE